MMAARLVAVAAVTPRYLYSHPGNRRSVSRNLFAAVIISAAPNGLMGARLCAASTVRLTSVLPM
jgi:hypothetical protein